MSDHVTLSDPAVTMTVDADIATIRIDDGKANALGHGVIDAVNEALDRAETDARVVCIVGRPGKFSAGFDLKVMTSGPEAAKALLAKGAELALRTYEFPHPVVFGVTGHALAMGAIWLLAADLRIGVEGPAKIGMNEVAIGMPVPRFAVELGRDRLSPRHFPHAVGLARIYDPDGAVEAGYLDRVITTPAFEASLHHEAAALATLHDGAFRATRRTQRSAVADLLRAGLEADVAEFFVAAP